MGVIDKAKELAVEILKTSEYKIMISAKEIAERDEIGASLLRDMELFQQEYIKSASENADEEELKMLEGILKSKHKELMDYEITAHMIKSKAAFERLIAIINKEITEGITGCSSDECSKCSGCN